MRPASACRLLTCEAGGQTLVRLSGERVELDEAHALWLRDRLEELVASGRRRLCLDLDNVSFLASTLVETLLHLHRKLKALGGRLSVCCLSPTAREVFGVLRLGEVLAVQDGPCWKPMDTAAAR
jgi:anti-sigma B factor antagonist